MNSSICSSKGCFFAWYFHYMPVGMGASTDLLLTPEQRTYMKNRVREIRGVTGGKEIFCIDFQNDGEFAGGCMWPAGALLPHQRRGDVEPCVFIHYSGANIREKSFLDACSSRYSRTTARASPSTTTTCAPAPCWKTPICLPEMVARSGAHSTDLERPRASSTCATSARRPTPPAGRGTIRVPFRV